MLHSWNFLKRASEYFLYIWMLTLEKQNSENNTFITIITLILSSYHEQRRSMTWLPFLPNELFMLLLSRIFSANHTFVTSTQAAQTELSIPNKHSHSLPLHKIKSLHFIKYSSAIAIKYLEGPECQRHMAHFLWNSNFNCKLRDSSICSLMLLLL